MEPKIINHWGHWVNSEKPITGVVTNNAVAWLNEEIATGIDVDYEAYERDNPEGLSPEKLNDVLEMWDASNSTYLIGDWRKDKDGLYEPEPTGDYAAIVGEVYTQVVFSHNVRRCSLCSPCYPGQGDLESEGDFLTYDLPADMYDSHD